jgi:predicted RNase H-like nuclease (RuvC/YqgF family)
MNTETHVHDCPPEITIPPNMTVSDLANLLLPKLNNTDILLRKVDSIDAKLSGYEARISQLEDTVDVQAGKISQLTEQRDRIIDEIRRPNLILHGLPETEKNTDELAKKILSIFEQTDLDVQIDAPFRLGKRIGKIRPVKVRFPLLTHRSAVLSRKAQLKSSSPSIFITEDLSVSTRIARRTAWEAKYGTSVPGPRMSLNQNLLQ